jgi:hypothetical protein
MTLRRAVAQDMLPREFATARVRWTTDEAAYADERAAGAYELTFPGYSPDCNAALVQINWHAGPWAIEREFVLIEHKDGQWQVVWSDVDFIA